VSCPDGFQWNLKVENCYTIEIYGPIEGTNLAKGCQNILPEAFPVEPRDSTQMDHIREVTGETLERVLEKVFVIWPSKIFGIILYKYIL